MTCLLLARVNLKTTKISSMKKSGIKMVEEIKPEIKNESRTCFSTKKNIVESDVDLTLLRIFFKDFFI